MLDLALDPHVIGIPETPTASSLTAYVSSLLDYITLSRGPWLRMMISAESEAAAVSDDRYPRYEVLSSYIARMGIREFDAQTVRTLVGQFMTRVTFLEDIVGIKDLVWRDLEWVVTDRPTPSSLNEALSRTAVLLCIMQIAGDPYESILVSEWSHQRAETNASARDILVESKHGSDQQYAVLEGRIVTVPSAEEFLLALDPVKLLATGDAIAAEASIRVAIYQRAAGGALDGLARPVFTLHGEFTELLRRHAFNEALNRKVLRACAETVLGENLPDTHALRTGAGPAEPQQTRGQDRAFRRDIDDEYHLHYWDRPVGGPELAAVVVHQDFTIPY